MPTAVNSVLTLEFVNNVRAAKSNSFRIKVVDSQGKVDEGTTEYLSKILFSRKMLTVIFGTDVWTDDHTARFNEYNAEIKRILGLV